MKKFFSLKNCLVLSAALFGLLVFIFSFVTALKDTTNLLVSDYKGIIWGSTQEITTNPGTGISVVTNHDPRPALALPIIGALLCLLSALALPVLTFFGSSLVKNKKTLKYVYLVIAGLLVLAGAFTFFTQASFQTYCVKPSDPANVSCALPIVSGILAILSGCATAVSQFLKK